MSIHCNYNFLVEIYIRREEEIQHRKYTNNVQTRNTTHKLKTNDLTCVKMFQLVKNDIWLCIFLMSVSNVTSLNFVIRDDLFNNYMISKTICLEDVSDRMPSAT